MKTKETYDQTTPKFDRNGDVVYATSRCGHGDHAKGEFCDYDLIAREEHARIPDRRGHRLEGAEFCCNHCSSAAKGVNCA